MKNGKVNPILVGLFLPNMVQKMTKKGDLGI